MNLKLYIKNPWMIVIKLGQSKVGRLIPDKTYLKSYFRYKMGYKLDLKTPQTFNEKLQWLKLYDHKSIYTKMVDKYEVKELVSQIIGEEYIIPTYGIWEKFEQIDFNALPDQFVLKCTHDSGGIYICKNRQEFDLVQAKKTIMASMQQDYYLNGREWPYRNVKPRIIIEKYMEDNTTKELRDYKFFCFDGKVKAMFIASERQNPNVDTKFDFFDREFNHLDIRHGHPNADVPPSKPINYDLMIKLAEKISEGIPELRVDFYEVEGKVYFGELTFYHHGGVTPFDPPEWDMIFGEWITLPR